MPPGLREHANCPHVVRASIYVRGPRGERRIPIGDFHRLPGTTPERDTNLAPDELILAVDLPPSPFAEGR